MEKITNQNKTGFYIRQRPAATMDIKGYTSSGTPDALPENYTTPRRSKKWEAR